MRHLFLCFSCALFILSGCTRQLAVRTDFFTQENLASYHIGTPDPNLHRSLIDQRLIITWNLSKCNFAYKQKFIRLTVRLKNGTEESHDYPVRYKESFVVYQVYEEKFRETGGISTYKAELWGDDTLIDEWLHPLWVELIKFNTDKDTTSKTP